jgi:hypothetical protein
MSFLKFWSKKDKGGEDDQKKEEVVDPEVEKRKLRHSLSISRSGRFKQRKRERSQILDKPDLFIGQDDKDHLGVNEDTASSSHNVSKSNTDKHNHNTNLPRSPNNTCRDHNSKLATDKLRLGPSVVT